MTPKETNAAVQVATKKIDRLLNLTYTAEFDWTKAIHIAVGSVLFHVPFMMYMPAIVFGSPWRLIVSVLSTLLLMRFMMGSPTTITMTPESAARLEEVFFQAEDNYYDGEA